MNICVGITWLLFSGFTNGVWSLTGKKKKLIKIVVFEAFVDGALVVIRDYFYIRDINFYCGSFNEITHV